MNLLEANYAKMPARVLRQFRERIFFFFGPHETSLFGADNDSS